MAETQNSDESAEKTGDARQTARLVKEINAFAAAHPGGTEAQVAYLGQRGARIVLVADDGAWGDLVATSRDIALAAVARAEVTEKESFDGEMADRVHTGPYEWSRMAGIQLGG